MGRKFLVVIFLLLVYPTIPTKILAAFIKFDSNPVISVGTSTSWDSNQVYGPSVIFDTNEFQAWFTGNNGLQRQIGYANSQNPFNFNKLINPVILWNVINPDDIGVEHPSILKQDVYKMWFSNVENSIRNFHLFYSTSINGLIWTTLTPLVFDLPIQSWETAGVGAPAVIISALNTYNLWYVSRGLYNGSTRWRIGYATSADGINWVKNPTPVLEASQSWEGADVGNPSVIFDEVSGIYEMFYHGDFGIGRATSSNGISWTRDPANPILTPTAGTFDARRVFNPYVLKKDGIYYMWYTGINSDNLWQIGLATSEALPPPLPTSTPSPTPSPTPTATPTPTFTITPTPTPSLTPTPSAPPTLAPIIIIPGLGASWNPKDIFSCSIDQSGTWEMAPYITIYNRLIKTLTDNAGLVLNKELYVYSYDWRQPLDKQAENLKKFIGQILATKPADTKFRLVGHSLGGLVIRSYLTNNPGNHHIVSALTVGTPHLGAVAAYPIWEKGEISGVDLTLQIAIDQLINHCRIIRTFIPPKKYVPVAKLRNPKDVIRYLVPVIKQLLPTFDYLKQNGQIKETSTLTQQNDWIPAHPFPVGKYNINFFTLSGENVSTLRFINVIKPAIRESVFGDWIDGKPTALEKINAGDGTVLNLSSQIEGLNNETMSGNHGDIIFSDTGISKILNFLELTGIPVVPAALEAPETSQTALTISLDQDAQIKITDPKGKLFEGKENIFVSYNPAVGLYRVELIASGNTQGFLHLSQVRSNEEPQTQNFSIHLIRNRPSRFYLIYNTNNTTPLNLIAL